MASKPTPGGSDGTYGSELNEFLDVSLAADGKVKTEALQTDSTAPVADAALANKKYIDDEISSAVSGAGFWKTDSSTVFNTTLTSANTFQDLDLSSYVGSNTALVFLEVNVVSVNVSFVAKPKGYGSATFSQHFDSDRPSGVGAVNMVGTKYFFIIVATNASGVIEIAANTSSNSVRLKLIGYVK